MKYFRASIFLLATVLSVPGLEASQYELNAGFDAANKSYEAGHYAEAAQDYQKLIAGGDVSAALYFNCGDAWFKLGKLGMAITCYREAQSLAPRDRDIKTNLQFARTRARGGDPYPAARWQSLVRSLNLNEWTVLTFAAAWAVFGLLIVNQLRPESKTRLRGYLILASALVVIFGTGFAVALDENLTPTAIVVTGEAEVRNGPLDESQSLFKVRDGIELEVLDRKDGWLQVEDAGQRTGWIRQDQVILFPKEPSTTVTDRAGKNPAES